MFLLLLLHLNNNNLKSYQNLSTFLPNQLRWSPWIEEDTDDGFSSNVLSTKALLITLLSCFLHLFLLKLTWQVVLIICTSSKTSVSYNCLCQTSWDDCPKDALHHEPCDSWHPVILTDSTSNVIQRYFHCVWCLTHDHALCPYVFHLDFDFAFLFNYPEPSSFSLFPKRNDVHQWRVP